ncbi:MAG: pyridoxal-dependent decarboxylase [candidate division KSB1 bacterium]|nr:pyridoxal-dependent decarboxylase [candidate division KSB1 bacterium]
MSPEEFVRCVEAAAAWLAEYYRRVETLPVLSRVQPGEIRAKLPPAPPLHGEPFVHMLRDLDEIILPGITHWQSPNWFAFFPANASFPSILGELISAGLGVQGMLWATSPACTELETHVLDWLAEMLALPAQFKSSASGGGVIQDTASSAALAAVIAGRERATAGRSNLEGAGGRLTAYASTQAHSSIEKAIRIAGIGSRNLRLIEVDERFAMRPELLEQTLREDLAAGFTPCFVCANVGSTSSNAMDPLPEIGAICRRYGVWLHVDAAMSGSAAICPDFRWILNGIEYADSLCFNPHKWLFTNFDCDVFYVADRRALIDAFTLTPEYLRNPASESGQVFDYRDWHVQLGRRFRALKLWFVIRHYGVEGLRHHLREHVRLAHWFAEQIRQSDRFELVVEPPLNLVCFRLKGDDARNQQLVELLNATGKLYLTHTKLNGRYTLRFCVGQTHTEERHVRAAWELIQQIAQTL